jgi:hypothetical protein
MIRAGKVRAARKRYLEMAPVLNEQSRRRFVVLEAPSRGVITLAPKTTVSRLQLTHNAPKIVSVSTCHTADDDRSHDDQVTFPRRPCATTNPVARTAFGERCSGKIRRYSRRSR